MKYLKKAIPVDAWQVPLNPDHTSPMPPVWVLDFVTSRVIDTPPDHVGVLVRVDGTWLKANPGDWILLDAKGLPYPCKAEVFSVTYEPLEGMDFGTALRLVKQGKRMMRKGWNGKGMWIDCLHGGDVFLPYLRLIYPVKSAMYPNGAIVPWSPTQTDVLATDWEVFA